MPGSFRVRVAWFDPLVPPSGHSGAGPRAPAQPTQARRALGAPPGALLARPDHRAPERRPRLPVRRSGAAAGRRAALPRLARLRHERRVSRAPRAGHSRSAARPQEHRVRDRDPGRARDRRDLRGGLRARPVPGGLGRGHAAPVAAPGDRLRALRTLGGVLARRPRAAEPGAVSRGGARPALRARSSGPPVLRVRGAPLLRPLPATARSVAARGVRRLHLARRSDGRDRLRPQLARLVVGVARADGRRVRPRRARRPPGVPAQALGRGRLQGPLPRAHRGARRPPLRAGAQPCRRRGRGRRRVQRGGDAAPPAGRRRAAQAGRALQPVPLAAAPGAAARRAGRRRARRRAAGGQRALRRPAGVHGVLRGLDPAAGGRRC